MADSMEGNFIVLYLGLLLPALMFLIAGLVIHSFIIGVNVSDWWKGRSVTSIDHIVIYLGISRLCAQFTVTLHFFLNIYLYSPLIIFYLVYCFFGYANLWFTSLLSTVLCLKISNLHTRLFLYLRRMILQRTMYFIVASLILSAFSCSIPLSMFRTEVTNGETYNTTMGNLSMTCTYINSIYYITMGDFIPLTFYFIFSVLLFSFLYHHTATMKMSSNLSINLKTYYSLMKFIFFTSLYNTLYFVVDCLGVFFEYFYCVDLNWLLIVLEFLPVLHSSYMIYRTAKFRNQISKLLQNVISFLFQRRNTETR